jgi:nitroreductase
MQALDALLNRVSVPRLLDPAPTQEQREVLFAAAMRAPDHGHLQPWRFDGRRRGARANGRVAGRSREAAGRRSD